MTEETEPARGSDDQDLATMWVRNETRARLEQAGQKLGMQTDDEILRAMMTLYTIHQKVENLVLDDIHMRLAARLSVAKSRAGAPASPLEEREEEDDEGEEEDNLLDDDEVGDEQAAPWSPQERAEAERDDLFLSLVLHVCEQQPFLEELYWYRRLAEVLTPLAVQFGTRTPLQTLEVLVAVYRTLGEKKGK